MTELIGHEYQLILADPPWRYEWPSTKSRMVERHYETMLLDDIKSLPVSRIAARDAVLFLWCPAPKLFEAREVMLAWGFSYRTNIVWDKESMGTGWYSRVQHEHLLIGRRGKGRATPLPGDRPRSVITSRRAEHSAKPDVVYDLLERMYPDRRKIELFARGRPRPGWHAWGNEVVLP